MSFISPAFSIQLYLRQNFDPVYTAVGPSKGGDANIIVCSRRDAHATVQVRIVDVDRNSRVTIQIRASIRCLSSSGKMPRGVMIVLGSTPPPPHQKTVYQSVPSPISMRT